MKRLLFLLAILGISPLGATSRVWQGGEVQPDYRAIETIRNADEIPRGALLFLIACLLGD